MKKTIEAFSKMKWAVLGLACIMIVLAACNKDDMNVRTPAAGLMTFNLAVDKPTVGFTLDGNVLGNAAIVYPGYTGTYLPVFVGSRSLRSYDFTNNTTLATSTHSFADSMYYSAFLLGNNGNYRHVVTRDNYDNVTPQTGKAWVRYINAVPDSTTSPTINVGELTETAAYGHVSNFMQVNAGSLDLSVQSGSTINANRNITVAENKIYTVLFVGLPNQSDTSRNVMVRFIENGTATN